MVQTDKTPVQPQVKKFPPWSSPLAVFVVVASYFGASLVGSGILQLYAASHHWNSKVTDAWMTNSVYAQFSGFVLIYGIMALTIYVFSRGYGVGLKALGLVRPRLLDPGIALLGLPVYIVGYFILTIFAKIIFPHLDLGQQQQLGFQPSHSTTAMILTFISLVVLPPLVEELVMRGFLLTSMLKHLSFLPAAVITSIIFASAHLEFGSGAPLLWVAAIDTFMLSLVLCYMRFKTGSLWPGIFLHAIKNGIAFASIFVFHLS